MNLKAARTDILLARSFSCCGSEDGGDAITHITDVRSVTRVRSQYAVEEVVVRPALHTHKRAGLTEGGRGGGQMKVCYLLEDEERWESSRNIQLDKVQTGLSVCHRRGFYNTHNRFRITRVTLVCPWWRDTVIPLSLSLTELVSL